MPLSIFLWHRDDLSGLQRSLTALHGAWLFYAQARSPLPLSCRLRVVDEGSPPPRDLEVVRILEKEKQISPWVFAAERLGASATRAELWIAAARAAPADEWFLSLESGDEVSVSFFVEAAARLSRGADAIWQLPRARDVRGAWRGLDRRSLRPGPSATPKRLAFAWSGSLGPAAIFASFSQPAFFPLRLAESMEIDLTLQADSAGREIRPWESASYVAGGRAKASAERERRRFEETISLALKHERRGWGVAFAFVGVLLATAWRARDAGGAGALRLFRAWRRLLT